MAEHLSEHFLGSVGVAGGAAFPFCGSRSPPFSRTGVPWEGGCFTLPLPFFDPNSAAGTCPGANVGSTVQTFCFNAACFARRSSTGFAVRSKRNLGQPGRRLMGWPGEPRGPGFGQKAWMMTQHRATRVRILTPSLTYSSLTGWVRANSDQTSAVRQHYSLRTRVDKLRTLCGSRNTV